MHQKSRYALDLQFFAEKSATVDGETFTIEDDDTDQVGYEVDETGGIEIPDTDEHDEATENDAETEEETIEDEEEPEDEPQEKGKKNPTANAVITERRKWQERMKALEKKASVADKLLTASGATSLEQLEEQIDSLKVRQYEDQGYDSQTAQMLVTMQRQQETLNQQLQKQKFDTEVQSLKADPFFADIEDWREELEPMAARTGQSLEAVYMSVRGRERMKEYEREVEQRNIANRTKKAKAKVDTSAGGGNVKKATGVKLTTDQLAIAKLAGMSPEEYYKHSKK